MIRAAIGATPESSSIDYRELDVSDPVQRKAAIRPRSL
jgi:hypothetical protein